MVEVYGEKAVEAGGFAGSLGAFLEIVQCVLQPRGKLFEPFYFRFVLRALEFAGSREHQISVLLNALFD